MLPILLLILCLPAALVIWVAVTECRRALRRPAPRSKQNEAQRMIAQFYHPRP